MTSTWTIPSELAHFDGETLLVVMDHEEAKLLLIEGRQLHYLKTIESPIKDIHRSDHEGGKSRTGSHGYTGGHETHDKEVYGSAFCKIVAEEMNNMYAHKHFERAVLFTPEDYTHDLEKHMKQSTLEVTEEYRGIVIKEDPMDILERILKSRGTI